MKLVRYGPVGAERPGLIDARGIIRDLSGHIAEIDGRVLGRHKLAELAALDATALPAVPGTPRLGAPFAMPTKIVGVGLNYRDHVEEAGQPMPAEPVLFMKATSAWSGPNDPVVLPRGSAKTDWEVELGVVVGARTSDVEEAAALERVAGYCIVNDVSERAYQLEGSGQWVKGKSADTFAPVGPYLVTRDEIPDPQRLRLWLEVDGERCQDGSTSAMIFGVACLVSYVSRFMTLLPGDLIATGTPAGVGLGMKPPRFLRAGNRMRLGIEGLGEMEQEVVAHTR